MLVFDFFSGTGSSTQAFIDAGHTVISFENIHRLNKWEPKKGSREITQDELELNGLYSTFIFQKN